MGQAVQGTESDLPVRRVNQSPVKPALMALFLGFIVTCYLNRSSGTYAISIWPASFWALIGVVLSFWSLRRHPRGLKWLFVVSWLLVLLFLSEEPQSVASGLLNRNEPAGLKVVSLNCAGGMPEAAKEALDLEPDLILLQESPSSTELKRLAAERYDQVVGPDASILAKGTLEPVQLPRTVSNFVAAEWSTDEGTKYFVISLRLLPPVFRLDYWNPALWSDYSNNRTSRITELNEVVQFLEANNPKLPVIVGGDFNTPPDPPVFAPLSRHARDSFAAGRGWGHTAVNSAPFARIDQIWTSSHLKALSNRVRTTKHSDHRMVVAIFERAR